MVDTHFSQSEFRKMGQDICYIVKRRFSFGVCLLESLVFQPIRNQRTRSHWGFTCMVCLIEFKVCCNFINWIMIQIEIQMGLGCFFSWIKLLILSKSVLYSQKLFVVMAGNCLVRSYNKGTKIQSQCSHIPDTPTDCMMTLCFWVRSGEWGVTM